MASSDKLVDLTRAALRAPVRRAVHSARTLSVLGALLVGFAGSTASAATVEVMTAGLTFTPDEVTINMGDSVHFSGLLFHNVAETHCPATAASVYNGGFRSGGTSAVLEWTQPFDQPGTFCYVCEPHVGDLMVGSVTVQAAVPALSSEALVILAALIGVVGMGFVYRELQRA